MRRAQFDAPAEDLQKPMDERGIRFRDLHRLLARLAPMHRDFEPHELLPVPWTHPELIASVPRTALGARNRSSSAAAWC